MSIHSTPREGREKFPEPLKPEVIAMYDLKDSIDGLRSALAQKGIRMETVEPFDDKAREQFDIAKTSVDRRKELADRIEPVEGLKVAA